MCNAMFWEQMFKYSGIEFGSLLAFTGFIGEGMCAKMAIALCINVRYLQKSPPLD